MKVIIFGATGMIGQGVLRECLLDHEIDRVTVVGRSTTGKTDKKLREIIHQDFLSVSTIESDLFGYDACFFCLGVSSVGMNEEEYRKITYDITMSVARTLVDLNPSMTFLYISGASTDSSEKGRIMWARVKGKTENDLLALPFKSAYMLRPGAILPVHGARSKTKLYRVVYTGLTPIFPIFKKLFPSLVITTETLGKSMITIAKQGYSKRVVENRDLAKIQLIK